MAYGTGLMDVLQSSTANTPVVFKDGNGTQVGTLCRAWVNFNGTGTVAIRASFNVSSITDNGTGDYTVNFTTAMPDANYAVCGSGGGSGSNYLFNKYAPSSQTTSAIRVINVAPSVALSDDAQMHVAVFR